MYQEPILLVYTLFHRYNTSRCNSNLDENTVVSSPQHLLTSGVVPNTHISYYDLNMVLPVPYPVNGCLWLRGSVNNLPTGVRTTLEPFR